MKTIDSRLRVVQAKLDEKGLCDVKISFTPSVSEISKERLTCIIAVVFEDYISGKSQTLELFGDSQMYEVINENN
jgi:hypothetical protein